MTIQDHLKLKQSTQQEYLANLKDEINKINTELISYQTRQEQYLTFISNSSIRREDILSKIADYESQLAKMIPELESALQNKESYSEHALEVQANFNDLNDQLTERSSTYNQRNSSFHQQQNRVSALEKEIEYKENNLKILT